MGRGNDCCNGFCVDKYFYTPSGTNVAQVFLAPGYRPWSWVNAHHLSPRLYHCSCASIRWDESFYFPRHHALLRPPPIPDSVLLFMLLLPHNSRHLKRKCTANTPLIHPTFPSLFSRRKKHCHIPGWRTTMLWSFKPGQRPRMRVYHDCPRVEALSQ